MDSLITTAARALAAPWLSLLAPLPPEGGKWTQETRSDAAFAGWTQFRLVLGDVVSGLRVLTAMFDPEGRPGRVSDLVARDGGRCQETAADASSRTADCPAPIGSPAANSTRRGGLPLKKRRSYDSWQ